MHSYGIIFIAKADEKSVKKSVKIRAKKVRNAREKLCGKTQKTHAIAHGKSAENTRANAREDPRGNAHKSVKIRADMHAKNVKYATHRRANYQAQKNGRYVRRKKEVL